LVDARAEFATSQAGRRCKAINRVVEDGDFPVPTGPACPGGWAHCTRGDVAAATPTAVAPRVNWERLQGRRAELLAQPNDALKIAVLAMYQRITMGDYDEYDRPPGVPDEHFPAVQPTRWARKRGCSIGG
jgi:hypothetical protein